MNKLNSFKCQSCRSNKLSYEKWIRCCEPIDIKLDGQIYYQLRVIDEENELGGVGGFICGECGLSVSYCGCRIETEKDLVDYLSIDPQIRKQKELEYEQLFELQMECDEKRKALQESEGFHSLSEEEKRLYLETQFNENKNENLQEN